MAQDVFAVFVSTAATVVDRRCRFRGFSAVWGGTAGRLTLRNGTPTNTDPIVEFTITTGTSRDQYIPGEGILFTTKLYVSVPAAAEATIFYD